MAEITVKNNYAVVDGDGNTADYGIMESKDSASLIDLKDGQTFMCDAPCLLTVKVRKVVFQ